MFAIVEAGGKQYTVSPNQTVQIEKLNKQKGDKVSFDKVLLVADGEDLKIGRPAVSGAKVTGTVIQQGKDKKIRVFKYKSKSRYRRTQGHRQPFTAVKIESIDFK